MEIKNEVLQIKQLNSDQKLVLGVIVKEQVPSMNVGCQLTTQDIATLLGMTYKLVADTLWCLVELGLVKSVVEDRQRETKLTALYKRTVKVEKEILKD